MRDKSLKKRRYIDESIGFMAIANKSFVEAKQSQFMNDEENKIDGKEDLLDCTRQYDSVNLFATLNSQD